MGRKKSKKTEEVSKYEHLAVSPASKKRFEFLARYFISAERTKVTQEDLLIDMMDVYEAKKKKEFLRDVKR